MRMQPGLLLIQRATLDSQLDQGLSFDSAGAPLETEMGPRVSRCGQSALTWQRSVVRIRLVLPNFKSLFLLNFAFFETVCFDVSLCGNTTAKKQ